MFFYFAFLTEMLRYKNSIVTAESGSIIVIVSGLQINIYLE
jgi:hypothetical protein